STFIKQLLTHPVAVINGGIIGVLALIYAGMSVFGALQYALDKSFECKTKRTYARFLLTALGMSAITGGIFVLASLFRIWVGLVRRAVVGTPSLPAALTLLSEGITFVAIFFIVLLIYTYIPRDRKTFAGVWPGALFSAIAVLVAQVIFSLVLRYTTLPFIFGSLTAIIVLLTWLDVAAILIILGAEIAAAWIDRNRRTMEISGKREKQ
ncbi:MAG: YihY/virulence factor BrkB family protein, partial [Chloroflexi bacterium]|nr:YihY/virulence factor BrkB family protein [Chloroflexota bacterium]